VNRLTASAAIIVCLLFALPAAASAAEKSIWGQPSEVAGASAFPMYETLGVDTVQFAIDWSTVAPARPADPTDPADLAYRWPASIDTAVQDARRHGMHIALMITRAPPWSNGGRTSIWAPSDPRDFADFATAAARRYPPVRRWMIWGEPNFGVRFMPNAKDDPIGARTYAPILDAAYGALKRVNAGNVVIGGMTWTAGDLRPAQFVRAMRLPNGRPPRLDWFGHNPFPFRYPDLSKPPLRDFRDISDLDTLGREIDDAYRETRGTPVPLWLSEFVIQSDHGSETFAEYVSRGQQAVWLKAAYRIADRLGPRVAGLGWLALVDEPPAENSANWGLLTSTLDRKPAWFAFYGAPSRRHAARVSMAGTVRSGWISSRGIAVRVRVRTGGRHSVQLRRRGKLVRVVRLTRSGTARLRLRSARRGLYSVRILSPRGETQERRLRVR